MLIHKQNNSYFILWLTNTIKASSSQRIYILSALMPSGLCLSNLAGEPRRRLGRA